MPARRNSVRSGGGGHGPDQSRDPKVFLSAYPKDTKAKMGVFPAFDVNSEEAQHAINFYKEHGTVINPTMAVYDLTWRRCVPPYGRSRRHNAISIDDHHCIAHGRCAGPIDQSAAGDC
jgi:hypothetical protein